MRSQSKIIFFGIVVRQWFYLFAPAMIKGKTQASKTIRFWRASYWHPHHLYQVTI